ncbi:MAG: glycosyltransferase, partial [Christiangramia sp.]|nr:glycosyltransferase [Christiangramia sp.]
MRNKIQEPTANENRVIKFLILLGIFSVLNFLVFFLKPEFHGNTFLFILLAISLFYGIIKKLYLWYNYSNISIPEEPEKTRQFTVDVLTTYFPGEPYQMTITTLEAILNIQYPHETFLCDEADDPYLKEFCKKNGIHHVTRDNRIDAKAGNINNALRKVANGEITVILDPDHIPDPDFLDRTVPYFSDPGIGFVQTVQGYYNTKETLVARGAAEQTFQFYGPMMMTLNSYGAVNAIGANCVFRRKALDSIGGHAPGLCEDMHTAMKLYAKDWKGIYVPKILAQGLAPSNLTSYFKQQLKWARGTFDLLFKVYPKLYGKFTTRQKIHFGVLPLHYLSGLICLINFIIPIISLLFSITPWKGNVIDFGLVILPVILSSIFIRTYIQKWVIERKERGFHLIGGLLEINTWWIYLLGFFYTIIDKNIPYLPTPKENEFATNLKIIIPNSIIAILSILAIIVGLSRDFTPFMIVMSGFALFNAIIMSLGIYLTIKTTNENNILKENLNKKVLTGLTSVRTGFFKAGNSLFTVSRFLALPLLLIILISSLSLKQHNDQVKWDDIASKPPEPSDAYYLGIFHPDRDTGTVNLDQILDIEKEQDVDFDIISLYTGWDVENRQNFPRNQLEEIHQKDAVPMITWEPWIKVDQETGDTDQSILKQISTGKYDSYIKYFARELAVYNKPIFLRFAHEFDNPQYPWSQTKGDLSIEFKSAWKHVFSIIKEEGAQNVIFVWNPWKPEEMHKFYPGDDYVDWAGVTLLNYGILNQNGKNVSFKRLYQPFHDKFYWFTNKPVMLSEFGSIKYPEEEQSDWLLNASKTIEKDFPEISAVVFFNSAFDDNIPAGRIYLDKYINWTTDSISLFKSDNAELLRLSSQDSKRDFKSYERKKFNYQVHGVRYKKGIQWIDNYYVLSRKNLLRDFRLMHEGGINTILYPGGNVYDYNLLKYSEQENIQVIYDFNAFNAVDHLDNSDKLQEVKGEVIEKVTEL